MHATSLIEQDIVNSLRPTIVELVNIWEYVGYDDSERSGRLKLTIHKLRALLEDVIGQENAARLDMEHRIECKRRDVAELCRLLRLPSYLPDRGLSSSALMKNLDQKFDELDAIRCTRCGEYCRIRTRILRLGQLLKHPAEVILAKLIKFPELCSTAEGASGDNCDCTVPINRIPEEAEIQELLQIHDELHNIYVPLAEQYTSLCQDISRIAMDIAYEPQTDCESEILRSFGLAYLGTQPTTVQTPGVVRKVNLQASHSNGFSAAPDPLSVVPLRVSEEPVIDEELLKWLADWRLRLVKEKARLVGTCEELRAHLTVMWRRLDKPDSERVQFLEQYAGYQPETLEALQEEVDRCQQVKWEKLDTYVGRLTTEALRLTRLCFVHEKILLPPSETASTDPEARANHLETVLEQLNQTYSFYKSIFDSIAFYDEQCRMLSEVELRLKDPSIFSNRGGVLLKTEKEKKRLVKEIQRAEQEVQTAIEQHEFKTKSTFVLPDGRTFKDYTAEQCSSGKPSRDPSRVRRSVTSNNSRPNSMNMSAPPGAPT